MSVLNSLLLDDALTTLTPSENESEMARDAARRLAVLLGTVQNGTMSLQVGGEELQVPTHAVRLLMRLLAEMGEGNGVKLLPIHAELSTQQAADLLNVSRPYLVKLLDEGALPSRRVGTHRRVLLHDLMEFKQRELALRLAALDELTALSQEMGLY